MSNSKRGFVYVGCYGVVDMECELFCMIIDIEQRGDIIQGYLGQQRDIAKGHPEYVILVRLSNNLKNEGPLPKMLNCPADGTHAGGAFQVH